MIIYHHIIHEDYFFCCGIYPSITHQDQFLIKLIYPRVVKIYFYLFIIIYHQVIHEDHFFCYLSSCETRISVFGYISA